MQRVARVRFMCLSVYQKFKTKMGKGMIFFLAKRCTVFNMIVKAQIDLSTARPSVLVL